MFKPVLYLAIFVIAILAIPNQGYKVVDSDRRDVSARNEVSFTRPRTNAERFKRRLPPLPAARRYDPTSTARKSGQPHTYLELI